MEQGSGYLGGGGALFLRTQMLLGDTLANILGQGCTLSMPLCAFNTVSGAPGLSKVRSPCSSRFSWLGKSQTFWLVRRFKIAELDLVADWGHKSTFWVIFLAVNKCFKIDFPFPLISFSHSIVTQTKGSIPATPHSQDEMTPSKWNLFDNVLAENNNETNLSPPGNRVGLNHQFWVQTCLEMFFSQLRGLLLQERQKENKNRAPSNPVVPTPGSSCCASGQDGGSTKVCKSSSIHFHSVAPPLCCWACTLGFRLRDSVPSWGIIIIPGFQEQSFILKTCLLIHFIFTHRILAGVSESCRFLERPSFKWSWLSRSWLDWNSACLSLFHSWAGLETKQQKMDSSQLCFLHRLLAVCSKCCCWPTELGLKWRRTEESWQNPCCISHILLI